MAEKKEAVEKPMNIYQKLQKSRVDLQNKKLKKTGKNKFSNYDYFELEDFLPYINEICFCNGLSTIFQFTNELATLDVVDADNTEKKISFSTPVEIASLKGCSAIQNIGGTQKYCRRYLYMMAFEIAESDSLDSGQVDYAAEELKQSNKDAKKKIPKASVLAIKNLIAETNTDETEFLNWAKVSKIEDITNDCLGLCMQLLNRKKQKAQKENEFPPELQI